MITLKCSDCLEHTSYELRGKISAAADQLELAGEQILKLHLGNPGLFGLSAPQAVLDGVAHNLDKSQSYCHSKGLPLAREAILTHWQQHDLPQTDVDNIFIGNGVSELIHVVLQALLNPGDEVLLPQPDYPLWSAATNLHGGVSVYYQCDEQNQWQPDVEHMASQINERTKAIVLINPNNPTGAVYTKEILQAIAELARKHQLLVFSDEIYSDIVYEPDDFTYFSSIADDLLTITFHGLSKNYLLAGYRCAWMVVSGDRSGAGEYLQGIHKLLTMRLCPNVPAQYAIPVALSDPEYSLLKQYPNMYAKRELIIKQLNSIEGLSCIKPAGSFYAYPAWDEAVVSWQHDEDWVLQFLQQYRILLAPGTTFGQPDQRHFRLVFLPKEEELLQLCASLRDFRDGL